MGFNSGFKGLIRCVVASTHCSVAYGCYHVACVFTVIVRITWISIICIHHQEILAHWKSLRWADHVTHV